MPELSEQVCGVVWGMGWGGVGDGAGGVCAESSVDLVRPSETNVVSNAFSNYSVVNS